MFSSDSDFQESSDTLSYTSRTGLDTGFLSDANFSAGLGSPDFSRRPRNLDSGLGLRPQDAFSPASMVYDGVPVLLQ